MTATLPPFGEILSPDAMAVLDERAFWKRLRELARQPALLHVAAMACRPGAGAFVTHLEHTYFPPTIPGRNAQFRVHVAIWQDLPWLIATFPARARRLADRSAARTGMRIADGVPTIMRPDPDRDLFFPMNAPSVFTLENAHGSVVYAGPAGRDAAVAAEQVQIDRIHQWVAEQHREN